jgi:signal transduction histidine kinase
MRNSLILKLMGAFLLVIAIGALVIFLLTSQATQNAFNLYSTRSGQVWAQRLAPDLADFFAQSNTWQGVDAFLQIELNGQITPGGGMMGQGRGPGAGRPGNNLTGTPAASGYGYGAGMSGMAGMGQRLILTDDRGVVISDTLNQLVGKQITAAELKNGASITANNRLVGTLIVSPNDLATANNPAADFLASVNGAILSSAAIAGGIALILGGVLFLQITAPLRKLKKAAAAVAGGDLSQRVNIHSRDEFGELGQTFNGMTESLEKFETQRRHLVADVAHELRTPLAAIQGTLEGIQDGVLPLDEEQVAALYSETMLLNRLVGDLKLLSLAEAGQLKLERQEIDLGIFLPRVVERDRPPAEQKQVRLDVEVQAGLPPVWMDGDRITQVLNNLIGNALRYTPEGGKISIQAALTSSGDEVQVSVVDSGQGIDPADLPYIFDRFYRADKSRTRSNGGSGLGLAIVKQLVEAHGGSVQAESPVYQGENQDGYGTKISFTLPKRLG